ncbi:MAG TPA: pyridoxal phosphate-dependent aminotransferase [Bryobacteraceae bacterium]|jgi:histidinol-phosphate/aromatic aminotransferase/cobyric acid decarboxylase-like protein
MSLTSAHSEQLLAKGFSRRQLGRIAGMFASGAAALPLFSEFAMAQDAERRMARANGGGGRRFYGPDYVRISSNENPMGPSKEGLEALVKVAPQSWRYSPNGEERDLVSTIAEMEGVPEDHIAVFAGSSDPLFRTACAFTSPTASWTMGDPGYASGAPAFIGSKVVKVPLRADYSHDVEGMIEKGPDAGVYYVCNPNNPSGTLTPRKDIEYLLAHKSKDAIVLCDEAYIHFSAKAQPANDLVAAGKDVIVLRTFSKIYGMAGIRAGFAMGRPDLLAKLRPFGVGFLPVPAVACATASLKAKSLVAERRALNKDIRSATFEFLDKKGIKYVPSEANFFMMEVGRPGGEYAKLMADQKVIIGRVWPAWPTMVRVTVGTAEEMSKFKAAAEKILAA